MFPSDAWNLPKHRSRTSRCLTESTLSTLSLKGTESGERTLSVPGWLVNSPTNQVVSHFRFNTPPFSLGFSTLPLRHPGNGRSQYGNVQFFNHFQVQCHLPHRSVLKFSCFWQTTHTIKHAQFRVIMMKKRGATLAFMGWIQE